MNTEKFKEIYAESRNGANSFYRHPLCRNVAFSAGVQDLADTGCHWLIDILVSELPAVFVKNEDVSNRCIVTVSVGHSKAVIRAEFQDDVVAWTRKVDYTDMPDGEWSFFVADEYGGPSRYRLILLTEY